MERWGADIVHDHTLIGPAFSANHPGLRVVSTNHGPFDREVSSIYQAIGGRVPVIAISDDHARRAPGEVVVAVIHHGLDVERFAVGAGSGDEHGPYLMFLGRMAPEKGAEEAAQVARATGRRLLIAAKVREPAERAYFSDHVEPLLGDGVEFVGELDHQGKVRLLGGATALLNPIRWPEPFGLVMIEAMACGTPVLTYPEGSAPELVDDGATGFLCDDFSELCQRVSVAGVLDRQTCRTSVERRFTTGRMVAEHLRVYDRLLSTAEAAA
jgi:glycosyltransferase involved in cell wall biosynthesis